LPSLATAKITRPLARAHLQSLCFMRDAHRVCAHALGVALPGLPGFPPLDSAFAKPAPDPFVCLPNNRVRKGRMTYVPDPVANASTGRNEEPHSVQCGGVSPEIEQRARAMVERYVEWVSE
jgi:hypothetical protein